MGPVAGIPGTFTSGMLFSYGGENTWMDHISPMSAGSFLVFRDTDNSYDCGVAYDPGTYRAVGTSFELGLLEDAGGISTRFVLLDSIMHFFGLGYGIEETAGSTQANRSMSLEVYPNPFTQMTIIKFQIPKPKSQINSNTRITSSKLKIYDATGRLVKSFTLSPMPHAQGIMWNGTDDAGCRLPAGIYFVQLEAGDLIKTEKVILLK
jgi:hypothetical protein